MGLFDFFNKNKNESYDLLAQLDAMTREMCANGCDADEIPNGFG